MTFTRHRGMWLVRGMATGAAVCLLAVACGPRLSPDPSGEVVSEAPLAPRGDLIVPLSPNTTVSSLPPVEPGEIAMRPVASAVITTPSGLNTKALLKLGFDTLASFPYRVRVGYPDPNSDRLGLVTDDELPLMIRDLDGRRVAVFGYIMPTRTQGRGVTQFLLARDQLACCFGASPLMNHWIHVTMPRSEPRLKILQPATVVGTLRVGELRKYGSIQSIYRLEGERLEITAEEADPGSTSASSP